MQIQQASDELMSWPFISQGGRQTHMLNSQEKPNDVQLPNSIQPQNQSDIKMLKVMIKGDNRIVIGNVIGQNTK